MNKLQSFKPYAGFDSRPGRSQIREPAYCGRFIRVFCSVVLSALSQLIGLANRASQRMVFGIALVAGQPVTQFLFVTFAT